MAARVLVTETLGDKALSILQEGGVEVEYHHLLEPELFVPKLKTCDAVIIRSAHRIKKEHLEAAPNVRIVARAGTGVDNIDVEAATERGVLVLNTSGANAQAAAEHTMGLMIALLRHIREADAHVRSGAWDRAAFFGEELHGKTLGVIGIGRVGGRVARMAGACGMKVFAYDPFLPEATIRERGATPLKRLEDLLPKAQVLTIHTPKSGPRLSMREFRMLPQGAYVLNVARGGLYDEKALEALLDEGWIKGAALDVFESEPPSSSGLLGRSDVVLTCHLGGSTFQAQDSIGTRIAEAVLKALGGGVPDEAVNVPFPPASADSDQLIAAGDTLGRLLAAQASEPGEITLMAGGLPKEALDLVSQAFLAGFLSTAGEEGVNVVNALSKAKARGIKLSVLSAVGDDSEPGRFSAWLSHDRTSTMSVVVNGGLPRLRSWSGTAFDLSLGQHLLWTRHADVPGIVGKVGTLLDRWELNIATLELSRAEKGGPAIMVLTLDAAPPEQLLAEIASLHGMESSGALWLPLVGERTTLLQST